MSMNTMNVALYEMPRLGFVRTDAPDTIYYLTYKDKVDSILSAGQLICDDDDYVVWGYANVDGVLAYIRAYGRDKENGVSINGDGNLVRYPKWDENEMVLLKLNPITRTGTWFYYFVDERFLPKGISKKEAEELWTIATYCRLAHYGNMRFDRESAEVLDFAPHYQAYKKIEDRCTFQFDERMA